MAKRHMKGARLCALWLLEFVFFVRCGVLGSTGGARASPTRRLTVSTIQMEPFVRMKWEPGLIGNERYEGYYVDVLRALAQEAGFDFRIKLVPDGKLGLLMDDGRWNGLIGELLHGDSDIALAPMTVTTERQKLVDFTTSVEPGHLTVMLNKPDTGQPEIRSLSQLISHSNIRYGIIKGGDEQTILKASNDSNLRLLWEKISREQSFMDNIYDGLEHVRRNNVGLILSAERAAFYVGKNPCDLDMVDKFGDGQNFALAVRKNSPHLVDINSALARLMTRRRFWYNLKARWWNHDCPGMVLDNAGFTERVEISTEDSTPSLRYLTITTRLEAPFVMEKQGRDGEYEGFMIDLLQELARVVPFEYRLIVSTDNLYGKRNKRGEWTGMVGQLLREEADLAAASFSIGSSKQQKRVLEFTKPFLHSTLSLLGKDQQSTDDLPVYIMEELLNHTNIQVGVVKHSITEKRIKKSRNEVLQQIWRKIKSSRGKNRVKTLQEGLNRVRNDKFVLVVESTDGTYWANKQPCDLMSHDQFMLINNYGMAVKKGNPLVELINTGMLDLQRRGLLQTYFHKWLNSGGCMEDYHDTDRLIDFDTMFGVFNPVTDKPTPTIMRPSDVQNLQTRMQTSTTTESVRSTESKTDRVILLSSLPNSAHQVGQNPRRTTSTDSENLRRTTPSRSHQWYRRTTPSLWDYIITPHAASKMAATTMAADPQYRHITPTKKNGATEFPLFVNGDRFIPPIHYITTIPDKTSDSEEHVEPEVSHEGDSDDIRLMIWNSFHASTTHRKTTTTERLPSTTLSTTTVAIPSPSTATPSVKVHLTLPDVAVEPSTTTTTTTTTQLPEPSSTTTATLRTPTTITTTATTTKTTVSTTAFKSTPVYKRKTTILPKHIPTPPGVPIIPINTTAVPVVTQIYTTAQTDWYETSNEYSHCVNFTYSKLLFVLIILLRFLIS